MTTTRDARFTVDGPAGRVCAVHRGGDPDAVPVLLLHPVNTAAAVWDDVAAALPGESVAVDYRGHGSSEPGPPYLPADFAADALAVLDHLGWNRVHLVGGSIGGAVSVEVAARASAEVASIACFGATLRIGLAEADLEPLLVELRELGVGGWFARHGHELLGPRARTGAARRLAELAGGRDTAMVEQIVRATFAHADSRAVAAALPRLPALVAVGSHDPTCPPAMAAELAELLGTPVTVLDGIGHLPMLEAPAEVAELITALHEHTR
ncbi:alpha/beta fold hydrolase [Pseudonocardia sp.]|uniref:alpha/beta fold hydrolase n=1 Tax=Pseudonocardia sp. TaxID=60912 RepID=UPI003D13B072